MYSQLLNGIIAHLTSDPKPSQADYLRSLRPVVRNLWRAYRPGVGNRVAISYKQRDVQAAYLLRYFPQYYYAAEQTITDLYDQNSLFVDGREFRASFFGCGPAPELCGALGFLRTRCAKVRRFVGYLVDIACDQWRIARKVVRECIVSRLWNRDQRTLNAVNLDFSKPGVFARAKDCPILSDAIGRADLITFCNCLNEIHNHSHSTCETNLRLLIRAMKPGATLLIMERQVYPGAEELLQSVEADALESGIARSGIETDQWVCDCQCVLNTMPVGVRSHLFDDSDGLKATRYVKSHRLALQRK